ncbi:hypothetical protein JHW43_006342 [Diplocarpon mali]|nr:hypothetical protein JHW43_006342 [Diplocarpon mali]
MSHENSPTRALLDWAEAHGTLVSPNVQIYNDFLTGLSLRAVKDIPPSTNLVNCSYTTTLSYLNAIETVAQFERHSEPFSASFLEVLSPNSADSLGLPVLWPEEDRRWLDGTNAEPPIKRRKELWEQEWQQGIVLLKKDFGGWADYTFPLYQWAASIFGSRSFRASLTLPEEIIVKSSSHHPEHLKLNLEHIKKDRFSILLPVTDIGNHDGINQVEWSPSPTHFGLINSQVILRGTQIYNYYGDKSNSELLVGYGFTLPGSEKDFVNLKLTPSPEAVRLRRSQTSHIVDSNQPEQEFMFHVMSHVEPVVFDKGLAELKFFSSGLIETMSCMVANKRERQYLLRNPGYSVEKDQEVFGGPLSRNILLVLRILHNKLQYELSRIVQLGASLGKGVAKNGSSPMQNFELISLEYAYAWLHQSYPELAFQVSRLISEDQEEPLPLNWAILVEDWNHTYWTVWLYILWMLRLQDKEGFQVRHPDFGTWMSAMDMAYDEVIATDPAAERLYADHHEGETIDFMIRNTTALPIPGPISRFRNFATYISEEETVFSNYKMQSGPQAGEIVGQKLLCIARMWPDFHHNLSRPWSIFLQSMG